MKKIKNSFSGDIMVVNTNLWFHSFHILEGLSISISDEFATPDTLPNEAPYIVERLVPKTSKFI